MVHISPQRHRMEVINIVLRSRWHRLTYYGRYGIILVENGC